MRKLASIRKIVNIQSIPNADAIEVATVDGWQVVVKKSEFNVGDLAVYLEVDAWVPHDLAPFLSKGAPPREFNGVKGQRLRTIRLRGQLSQGLLLPLEAVFPTASGLPVEGQDVTEILGIQKWELPVPLHLAGMVRGNFPTQIPKTDQERCQNLINEISAACGQEFEVSEKLEGSSMTCYLINGEFGVCSRNLDLKRDENNAFWSTALAQDVENKMRSMGDNFAVQAELVGPGVQGNIYKLVATDFYIFDVYDIVKGEYLKPDDRRQFVDKLGLKHVPVLNTNMMLKHTVAELLTLAEGTSILNTKQEREGIVFKSCQGGLTFKAISNQYLLDSK